MGFGGMYSGPQGLKPCRFWDSCGTTEVVPFPLRTSYGVLALSVRSSGHWGSGSGVSGFWGFGFLGFWSSGHWALGILVNAVFQSVWFNVQL